MGTESDKSGDAKIEKMWALLAKETNDYIEARDLWDRYAKMSVAARKVAEVLKTWPEPDTWHIAWLENVAVMCETEKKSWEVIFTSIGEDMDRLNKKLQNEV